MDSVFNILKEVINLLELRTKTETEEEEKEIKTSKEAYNWILEQIKLPKNKRVEINNDSYLQPGKIYIFKYLADNKLDLDYWDKHPIVLVLGKMKGKQENIFLGLNISWYPPEARKYLVEKIRFFYKQKYDLAIKNKSFNANDQQPIYLDLYQLKTALDQFGFSFALRFYNPKNIKSSKICICYEDWDKAILLSQPRIFPELIQNNSFFSLSNIYIEFIKYIKYQRNNKQLLKKKMDESKKSKKYKFIK